MNIRDLTELKLAGVCEQANFMAKFLRQEPKLMINQQNPDPEVSSLSPRGYDGCKRA